MKKIQWPEPLNNLLWNSNKDGGFIHNDQNHEYSILQKAFIKPRIDFTEDSFQGKIRIYAGTLVLVSVAVILLPGLDLNNSFQLLKPIKEELHVPENWF